MSSTANSIQSGTNTFVLNDSKNRQSKKGGAIIVGVSIVTALIAGVLTSRRATKKSLMHYAKQMKQQPVVPLESPYMLAFKALGVGTVLAVGGVSLLTVGTCLCLDIRSLEDLREKIRKNRGPVDPSTNFETFQDLFNYLSAESKKSKSNAKELEAKS